MIIVQKSQLHGMLFLLELELSLHYFLKINYICHCGSKINGCQCIVSFTSGKILNWRQCMLNSMLTYEAFR